MTINLADNSPRVSYSVASGVTQTSFAVPFEFFAEESLNVYVDGTLKTLSTDYTVTGGDGSTGSITMTVTGASGGSTVVITREIDLERTSDFPTSGPFQISALNTELDRIIAIAADLNDRADRSIHAEDFDTTASYTLPVLNSRKGTVLAFNATSGDVEVGPKIANVQSLANISADIALLADIEDGTTATNAITNLNTIRANITTVAGISSDVTTVSGISADVSAVENISANVTTVAGISSDVTSVAGISADVSTVASDSANIGTLAGISANITTVAGDTANISTIVTDLNGADNIGTVATNISNVNAVGAGIANVNTVATNLASINSFAETYRIGATDPTTSLDDGDLFYNTASNTLKIYNGSAWEAGVTAGSGFLPTTGGSVTGELIAKSYNETYEAVTSTSNATTVNCENGNTFSHVLTEATTFTFSNPPASGTAYAMSIEIIQDGSASGYAITWPSSVDWPSGTAPTISATASAVDVFVFTTRDGGTTWYGFIAGQALATPA